MRYYSGQQILYKGIGETNWYQGVYLRPYSPSRPNTHVLKGHLDMEIHRQTENIRPAKVFTNIQAKTLLEEEY